MSAVQKSLPLHRFLVTTLAIIGLLMPILLIMGQYILLYSPSQHNIS